VIAAIFWLKTRAGWKETSVHEVSSPKGQSLEVSVVAPSAREQLEQRLRGIAERVANREPVAKTI